MLGGVVLTRCGNMLSGDRLLVDMTTGVSRVEADSGKVKVVTTKMRRPPARRAWLASTHGIAIFMVSVPLEVATDFPQERNQP